MLPKKIGQEKKSRIHKKRILASDFSNYTSVALAIVRQEAKPSSDFF
jgi:hypothetical protein